MVRGVHTSEFWVAVLSPLLGGVYAAIVAYVSHSNALTPYLVVIFPGIAAIYTIARTWLKTSFGIAIPDPPPVNASPIIHTPNGYVGDTPTQPVKLVQPTGGNSAL